MSVNSLTEDFWDLAVIGGKRLLQTCFGFLDNATGDKAEQLIWELPHINKHGCTSISSVIFRALLWQDHKRFILKTVSQCYRYIYPSLILQSNWEGDYREALCDINAHKWDFCFCSAALKKHLNAVYILYFGIYNWLIYFDFEAVYFCYPLRCYCNKSPTRNVGMMVKCVLLCLLSFTDIHY